MSKKCKTCMYRAGCNVDYECDYILITGHSRPCEPGDKCTEYKKGKRISTDNTIKITPSSARLRDEAWLDKFLYT